jgi:hypothetical protein
LFDCTKRVFSFQFSVSGFQFSVFSFQKMTATPPSGRGAAAISELPVPSFQFSEKERDPAERTGRGATVILVCGPNLK